MEVVPVATPRTPRSREPGPSKGRSRPYDDDFASYLGARQPALLRTAYLLTGSQHGAEDLVQEPFAKAYAAFGVFPQ